MIVYQIINLYVLLVDMVIINAVQLFQLRYSKILIIHIINVCNMLKHTIVMLIQVLII